VPQAHSASWPARSYGRTSPHSSPSSEERRKGVCVSLAAFAGRKCRAKAIAPCALELVPRMWPGRLFGPASSVQPRHCPHTVHIVHRVHIVHYVHIVQRCCNQTDTDPAENRGLSRIIHRADTEKRFLVFDFRLPRAGSSDRKSKIENRKCLPRLFGAGSAANMSSAVKSPA